jgi:predicted PurR-regulated permease PerM
VVIGFIALAAFLYGARNALVLVAIAFFLALAFSRPVSWLSKKLPGNSRVGATAVAFIAVVAIFTTVIVLIIPPIIDQSAKLANSLPGLLDNAKSQWGGLNDLINQYNLQPQIDQAVKTIKDGALSWASNLGQGILAGVSSLIVSFTTSLIVLFMTFFMLVEGPEWVSRIWLLYRDKNKMHYHKKLLGRMYNVVTGYVTGQVTVSTIDGIAAGLAVFVISLFFHEVPSSLALPVAALSFVLSMIPMFGATIAGTLATLLIALNNIPAAIIYIVYFFVYQQIENNVIVPTVQSKSLNLSALSILIAVTIGIFMFGLLGGIVAIPIAGCIRVLADEYLGHVEDERESDARSAARSLKARLLKKKDA